MLVLMVLVRDLARLIMIVLPVRDAKAVFAFWDVIPRMIALITLFAIANSVFLAALPTISVLTELFAETISAKLDAKIMATASLEPSVLTASVILVVLKLQTALFLDNNATTVSVTFSVAKITLIA
jgi:hypothetical protein